MTDVKCACGQFFSSVDFSGMCSKCFKELAAKKVKAEPEAVAKAGEKSAPSYENTAETPPVDGGNVKAAPPAKVVKAKRCFQCHKKTGLALGILYCKCGNHYCSKHRYADQHGCTFDHKALGKALIEKQNPKLEAKKIDRI